MSDFKGLWQHSRNYFIANIANKALAFITIPVYTRILSINDYGVVNLFNSYAAIFAVLMTLNAEVSISRYLYEMNDREDSQIYTGTIIMFSFFLFLTSSILVVIFSDSLCKILSFPSSWLVLSLIPICFYQLTLSVFQQIYVPMKESKRVAIVSTIQGYLTFGLSVVAIFLLPLPKYYGVVIGGGASMGLLCFYLCKCIKKNVRFHLRMNDLYYSIKYSLPYLFYSLSSILIPQFGRILLSKNAGYLDVGLYSFVSNFGTLMVMFISVTHQAWEPYYFQYMNDGDITSLKKDYDIIWRITLFLGLGLSYFGYELAWILAEPEYLYSMYLLPILVIGYLFYQWSFVYIRNAGFKKQMLWGAISISIGGVVNIVSSIYFANMWELNGIAIAFVLTYVVVCFISWAINRFFLKLYVPDFKTFLRPLLFFIPFWSFSLLFYFYSSESVLMLLIKLLAIIIYAYFSFNKELKLVLKIRYL